MNTDSDTEKKDEEYLKFAYEQSIIAYQHHVQRYSTWMNMYAIITGALFVAFYSIYGNESECVVHGDMLLILISVLGFICSLCWYGTVKGHYEWMKSFMAIVKKNERGYFRNCESEPPFVYSKVIPQSTYYPEGNFILCFLSTQKITLLFIHLISISWIISLGFFMDEVISEVIFGIEMFLFVMNVSLNLLLRLLREKSDKYHLFKKVLVVFCWLMQQIHSTIYSEEIEN